MIEADIGEHAVFAVRLSRVAYLSAMEDKQVMRSRPLIFRKTLHQTFFYAFRIFRAGKPNAVSDSEYMGINRYTGLSEALGKDHIGGLTAYARQFYKIIKVPRNLSAEVRYKHL